MLFFSCEEVLHVEDLRADSSVEDDVDLARPELTLRSHPSCLSSAGVDGGAVSTPLAWVMSMICRFASSSSFLRYSLSSQRFAICSD